MPPATPVRSSGHSVRRSPGFEMDRARPGQVPQGDTPRKVNGMASNLKGGAGLQTGATPRFGTPPRNRLLTGLVVAAVLFVLIAVASVFFTRGNSAARASSSNGP